MQVPIRVMMFYEFASYSSHKANENILLFSWDSGGWIWDFYKVLIVEKLNSGAALKNFVTPPKETLRKIAANATMRM